MVELIAANPHWFWLSLGGVLLAAEMLGASGYLLWSGVAALIVGALVWLLPQLPWEWQGTIFAALTVIVAYLWWYWLRQRPAAAASGAQVLNQRNRQLIGTRATLTEAMHNGMGRINIGDSSWRAQAAEDLPVGTEVEVIAVEGVTLVIRAVGR
ncbi:Inner membrane protein ybbJ [Serratia entomophila]|jgi:membrane protein implicated in regulation of membrane protease activity|uniref:NfeD family protein n=1 Tax=Serratia entomophila TaxID=42906 RepID=A0ABY5CWF2_9GAMM|nr:NfeD family protein [Serratia entomophila]UIW19431.1 NfeD family protein [Serratia entomophila]USV02017.1 NfeD family protein [Serratia entomophila]CAI0717775.1 Inner membrane protein ybbJ [Serratia entomophila]CAI0767187.1 Inner membrane protein ybbJ [Serratia entomophila]CAI0789142.1 Inner membrane protein ybbJ [Serratia entomophila]